MLHSRIKFLEEENDILRLKYNIQVEENEILKNSTLKSTFRQLNEKYATIKIVEPPVKKYISLESVPFQKIAAIETTIEKLKNFGFPFQLTGKDLVLAKDCQLKPKESLRFAIQTLI